ncbi:MAG: hypothetical protein CM15mP74_01610 [Halieaceae bacterium]|nr:MAG: hypothetical protein CM15mP74_01610 [Halieaceae bacterium]
MAATRQKSTVSDACAARRWRVDGTAVLENFEVNMRSGRAPCTAHQSDYVPAANQVADLYKVFLIMSVTRTESIAVGHFNHRAIARPVPTPAHYAAGHCEYVRAITTAKSMPACQARSPVIGSMRFPKARIAIQLEWAPAGVDSAGAAQPTTNLQERRTAPLSGKQGIQSTKL